VRTTALSLAVLLVLGVLSLAPASATEGGENITPDHNLPFPTVDNGEGTDSDFLTYDIDPTDGVNERTVGVFGSIGAGAWILDVTDGGEPTQLAFYSCSIGQGDIQIFQQGDKTYFAFTDDGYSAERNEPSACQQWATGDADFTGGNKQGTFIVDITDPTQPTNVDFIPFPRGSHNQTVHPSGNFLYNSNSELITNAANAGIEVWEITDIATTAPVSHGVMPLPVRPGLGTDSHDITFNADGTRAYSAALSQTVIINTEDPAEPFVVTSFVDPAINVEHQANPVTLTDPLLGEREFLIVEDEFAGAAGAEQTCPSGGTHVYDITDETLPVKVGSWYVGDVANTNAVGLNSCTAHVFDIHEDAQIMTMSFYGGGVRVIDLTGLVGLSVGGVGVGMKEIGYHRFEDSNSWSVKAPLVERNEDGSLKDFHLYSNDINRGVDTYLFSTGGEVATGTGNGGWFPGTSFVETFGATVMPADYEPFCLLRAAGEPARGLAAPTLIDGGTGVLLGDISAA
jgi:hypothetical protein